MTANKSNLLTQIETALARDSANVSANLIGIMQIFCALDERLAAMEPKLERLLTPPPASAHAEQLIALLDQRIKAQLEREQRVLCQATGEVVRDVLREFVDEFKQVRCEIELKLKQVEALLAARPPPDPPPRPERPN